MCKLRLPNTIFSAFIIRKASQIFTLYNVLTFNDQKRRGLTRHIVVSIIHGTDIHHICTTMCWTKRFYPLLVGQIVFYTLASFSLAFNTSTLRDSTTHRTSRRPLHFSLGRRIFPFPTEFRAW